MNSIANYGENELNFYNNQLIEPLLSYGINILISS